MSHQRRGAFRGGVGEKQPPVAGGDLPSPPSSPHLRSSPTEPNTGPNGRGEASAPAGQLTVLARSRHSRPPERWNVHRWAPGGNHYLLSDALRLTNYSTSRIVARNRR